MRILQVSSKKNPISQNKPWFSHVISQSSRHFSFLLKTKIQAPSQQDAINMQKKILRYIVSFAKKTTIGRYYNFSAIDDYRSYCSFVPVHHYDDMEHWILSALQWKKNILCPGIVPWFATSSGTTGKSKYIPVTLSSLRHNHFSWWKHLLYAYYSANSRNSFLSNGYGLVLWWTFQRNPYNWRYNVWFISAILQRTSPWFSKILRQPRDRISYIDNWWQKVQSIISWTSHKYITSISWQPSWCSHFLQQCVDYYNLDSIFDLWPDFSLVIRWGMDISFYKSTFQRLLPSDHVQYYQVYNASEWFFAIQDANCIDDMQLLVHHGVFYEFLLLYDYTQGLYDNCISLADVCVDVSYVLLITNLSGLYRYVLGDVVSFTCLSPYRLRVVGRTSTYIDLAGECSYAHQISQAINQFSLETWLSIQYYTFAPAKSSLQKQFFYDVVIEIQQDCDVSKDYASILDKLLCDCNIYYKDERYYTRTLKKCRIRFVQQWTFFSWLESQGRVWWQSKPPYVKNDRIAIDSLLLYNGSVFLYDSFF
jgi:hypothetical protein